MTYGHGPTWLTQRDAWLTTARRELELDHGYQRPAPTETNSPQED